MPLTIATLGMITPWKVCTIANVNYFTPLLARTLHFVYSYFIVCALAGETITLFFEAEEDSDYAPDEGYVTFTSSGPAVGGVSSPINKFEILTPYLVLAGLIAVVSAVYFIKKRKD